MNELQKIILKYPNKPWNGISLSINPCIDMEFIKKTPFIKWQPSLISCNPSITKYDIINNPSYPWDLRAICKNPNIDMEFIEQYFMNQENEIFIDWDALSMHPLITIQDIKKYKNKPWNFYFVSFNKNIFSNYILNEASDKNWNEIALSSNPGITETDIYKNKFNWVYNNLSSNVNLPLKYVIDNIDKPWNISYLSANEGVTINEIIEYKLIPWDYYNGVSINPNINWKFIESNLDKNWYWNNILIHKNISLDIIYSNKDLFTGSDHRINFKIKDREFIDLLCSNPNITEEWVTQNIKYINWNKLSNNKFGK